jgi:hypothetical protein
MSQKGVQLSHRKTPTRLGKLAALIDRLSGWLIMTAIIFAPWAFGTVHDWSILVMNTIGFLLGGLLFFQIRIQSKIQTQHQSTIRFETAERLLMISAFALIIYTAIHALNGRASFDQSKLIFSYRTNYISWLPHSYDIKASWNVLFRYSALFLSFFSTISWLKYKLTALPNKSYSKLGFESAGLLPKRIRQLLTVICLSSGLMALVGLLQKLDTSPNLLWILEPKFNTNPEYNFGPFAYRGNASTYFNMVWPLCLYLIIMLRKLSIPSNRTGNNPHLVLLPCLGMTILAPIITSSRAGISVLFFQAVVLCLYFFLVEKYSRKRLSLIILTSLVLVSLSTAALNQFRGLERFRSTIEEALSSNTRTHHNFQQESRFDIYHRLPAIAKQNAVWGYGPGSFSSIYFVHRQPILVHGDNSELVSWSAWAHCDPFETIISFGIIGTSIIVFFLSVAVIYPLIYYKQYSGDYHILLIILPLVGCIIHSLLDFPFQIYSLLHLFLTILAIGWSTTVHLRLSILESNTHRKKSK